ncbi:hypothetical protein AAFN88_20500 [Pelagibius sp. CAU 1746]|uniref:hypothetical protein n=1 Tax=Pelagibius sp. CAU 1746 TaxID=3140370 RepID=UPI00325BD51F
MDQTKRAALIAKIKAIGGSDESDHEAVVGIEDFFEGNDDLGSIGANLPQHPGLARFREVLSSIRDRAGVSDLVIAIWEVQPETLRPSPELEPGHRLLAVWWD